MELRIGAIQMASGNGDIEGNLRRAVPLVADAAARGAQLICLPEFLPSGYLFEEACWRAAEKNNGLTIQWLAEQARRLNVTLGTSFLEADGDDFKNVFVLMGPEKEYGRVYKQDIALYENFFMTGQAGPHVIETPFGKIGVGICYENLRSFLSRLLVEGDVDLLLQPHSCPGFPNSLPGPLKVHLEREIGDTSRRYAEQLGIPTVFVNKCGTFDSPTPLFPRLRLKVPFLGCTSITDSDGKVLAKADEGQAVLVATVKVDPARKTRKPLPARGPWANGLPWYALKFMEYINNRGRKSYRRNPRRAAASRNIQGS